MSKIILVDENDRVIGSKERSEVLASDIYRVSCLWITNSNGDILLQKRSMNKTHSPGGWRPAVAGTVEVGESRESNIIKEAEEELGITGIGFRTGPKFRVSGRDNYFSQVFFVRLDWDIDQFKPDPGEMDEIKWFKKDELVKLVKNKPDNFGTVIPRLLESDS